MIPGVLNINGDVAGPFPTPLSPFAQAVKGILHCDEKERELLALLLSSLVVDVKEFERLKRSDGASSSV